MCARGAVAREGGGPQQEGRCRCRATDLLVLEDAAVVHERECVRTLAVRADGRLGDPTAVDKHREGVVALEALEVRLEKASRLPRRCVRIGLAVIGG